MIENLVILDNVISKKYANDIENLVLGDEFPWYFKSDITYNTVEFGQNCNPGFGHQLFFEKYQSPHWPFFIPLLYQAVENIDYNLKTIMNSRLFMQIPNITDKLHNNAHVDGITSHMVALYYVTDSDGPTYIFEANSSNTNQFESQLLNSKTHNHITVDPKKGRLVFFNGKHFHASSAPKNSTRCVLNYNFL